MNEFHIVPAYTLWLGVMVVNRIRGKGNLLLRANIEHAFRRYFTVVFPLLIIAAGIESLDIIRFLH